MKKYTAFITAEILSMEMEETVCTFLPTDSFAEACEVAEKYFGDELISINIELMDTPLITFSEDIKNQIIDSL